MERGILKRWQGSWGIVYAVESKRYFLHVTQIVDGEPELGRFVTFEVGSARTPTELPQALNAHIGPMAGAQ
jgi:hypothetical protein